MIPLKLLSQIIVLTNGSTLTNISTLTSTLLANPFGTFNPHPFAMAYSFDYGDPPLHEGVQVQFRDWQYECPENIFWSYGFGLYGTTYGALPVGLFTFTPESFPGALENLKMARQEFYFSEASYLFDGSTANYLGGIGYNGSGSITNITAIPEPSTLFLLSSGLACLVGLRRKRPLRKIKNFQERLATNSA
jgi:hypothetical protein